MSSSLIKTHAHENYDILKQFTESPDSVLLYKGKPIIATSTHETLSVNTETGIHGLRYYNKKLQYYNGKWNDIATGGGTTVVDKDIIISPSANNILVKYPNGYYVQGFLISSQPNNAIAKYADGYYVPKIPANNATTNDVDAAKDEINNKLVQQTQVFNERYDIITDKIKEITSNTTKFKTHEYSGYNLTLDEIIDVTTLYNLASDVILNFEFMLQNTSDTDPLTVKIIENGVQTLNDTLTKSEIQRYKLPNIPTIKIFIKGNFRLFLYITYV